MSKSLGNLITIKEAVERYSADAIRIFVLSSHYRSPITYSEEGLEAAERGTERLRQAARGEGRGEKVGEKIDIESYRQRFTEAMDDDFSTAQALAIIFDLAREINRLSDEGYSVAQGQQLLSELANILGLTLKPPEKQIGGQATFEGLQTAIAQTRGDKLRSLLHEIENVAENPAMDIRSVEGYINLVLGVRESLRKDKEFQLADEIRKRLTRCGFTVKDTPLRPEWMFKR